MLRADPPIRIPGAAAVFGATSGIPLALVHHLKHNHVLHERLLLVSTRTTDTPYVEPEQRAEVIAMECGLTRVVLSFGFMEKPDVAEALHLACQTRRFGTWTRTASPTISAARPSSPPSRPTGMAHWRKAIFAAMLLNANRSAAYYCLPLAQVVEVGLEVEI